MILVNLLPPEFRKVEAQKIVLPEIPIKKTLIITASALLGIQLLLSLATLFLVMRSSALKKEVQTLTAEMKETQKIKSDTVSALNKLKDIRILTSKKFYWASVLNALTSSATRGVWLRSLSLEETVVNVAKKTETAGEKKSEVKTERIKTMKLEGSVHAAGQETAFIGKFVKALKDNAYFKDLFGEIELSNINQRKIGEYDVADFVLICKFKKDKL